MANINRPSNSLYVGDLHPLVTERILFEKFQPFGHIISLRLCRDSKSGKSFRYAYINYKTVDEAEIAMQNMNLENIYDRPCRIMWSERDPTSRRLAIGNIVVKNLDLSVTAKQVRDVFSTFGEIVSCKLCTDKGGRFTGQAFINFVREEEAENAIKYVDGKRIENKIVHVEKFIPRNERNKDNTTFTNCFIKNFADHLNDDSLKKMFERFGEIVSAKVMVDDNGDSEGYGFVSFKNHEDALKAVNALNGTTIGGQSIYVGRFIKQSERQIEKSVNRSQTSGSNIYINNLGKHIDDDQLKQEFASFGTITSAKVMLNENDNSSMGYGFVCFSTPEEARRAVSKMNRKVLGGKPLYVSLSQKKKVIERHKQSKINKPQSSISNNGFQHNLVSNNTRPSQTPSMNYNQGAMKQDGEKMGRNIEGDLNIISKFTLDKSFEVKQNLGERLYPLVRKIAGDLAGKITGMFLELDNVEVLCMIINENFLKMKISEALVVLKAHKEGTSIINQSHDPIRSDQRSKDMLSEDKDRCKQQVKERVFRIACKYAGNKAEKVTEMLLILGCDELLKIIDDENALKKKVDKLLVILKSPSVGSEESYRSENESFEEVESTISYETNSYYMDEFTETTDPPDTFSECSSESAKLKETINDIMEYVEKLKAISNSGHFILPKSTKPRLQMTKREEEEELSSSSSDRETESLREPSPSEINSSSKLESFDKTLKEINCCVKNLRMKFE